MGEIGYEIRTRFRIKKIFLERCKKIKLVAGTQVLVNKMDIFLLTTATYDFSYKHYASKTVSTCKKMRHSTKPFAVHYPYKFRPISSQWIALESRGINCVMHGLSIRCLPPRDFQGPTAI